MNSLQVQHVRVASTLKSIGQVRLLEKIAGKMPQVAVETTHTIHGGMYARTAKIPAGTLITGAEIKIATMLIVHGSALIYGAEGTIDVENSAVLCASAGRKQAILARGDVELTMVFPTTAHSVAEAEAEFTDETSLLSSREKSAINNIIITGE